jgi:hypothetical protein
MASFLEVLEKVLATLFTEVVDLKDDFKEMRKLGFKKSCVSYLALCINKDRRWLYENILMKLQSGIKQLPDLINVVLYSIDESGLGFGWSFGRKAS